MEKEIKNLFMLKPLSNINNLVDKTKRYSSHHYKAYKKMQYFMNKYHYILLKECADCNINFSNSSSNNKIKHKKIRRYGCCTQGCLDSDSDSDSESERAAWRHREWRALRKIADSYASSSDSEDSPFYCCSKKYLQEQKQKKMEEEILNSKIYSIEDAKKEIEKRSSITITHVIHYYCIYHVTDNIKSKEEVEIDNKQMKNFNQKYEQIRRLIYPKTKKFVINEVDFPSLS